jgi:hypothetical protein
MKIPTTGAAVMLPTKEAASRYARPPEPRNSLTHEKDGRPAARLVLARAVGYFPPRSPGQSPSSRAILPL